LRGETTQELKLFRFRITIGCYTMALLNQICAIALSLMDYGPIRLYE